MTLSQQDIVSGKARIQSPYLYIQAAGSDGSDHSSPGIHLRWDFLRTLGDTHLPKGSLAGGGGPFPAAGGFNKNNDFVSVLRAPYDTTYPVKLDLRSQQPDAILESGNTRSWRFNITVNSTAAGEVVIMVLRFADVTLYDTVRSTIDPSANSLDFIKAYTGVVEAEVENNLSFAIAWTVEQPEEEASPGQLRVETVSAEENLATSAVYLSTRNTFTVTGVQNPSSPSRPIAQQVVQLDVDAKLDIEKVYGENIRYARFDYTGCFPVAITMETYRHFIQGKTVRGQWSVVREDFALSINDTEVFRRLEDTPYPVNKKWPRYFGADPVTGRYTVSVPNYIDKWITKAPGEEGLKDLLLQYLDLSRNPDNPTGIRAIHPERPEDDPAEQDSEEDYEFEAPPAPEEAGGIDEAGTSIDSLSMIKLIASDFHVARMFGFGHIDGGSEDPGQKYIYLALYETSASLEPGQAASAVVHVSMTLPTGRNDYRLPVDTELKPLTYGLKSLNGSTRSITDADGYIPNSAVRIINLHIAPSILGTEIGAFYESSDTFAVSDITLPVCYGVKYKSSADTDWRIPELSNDPEYQDEAGVNETVPLTVETSDYPEDDETKLYVHTEEEEGMHQYAVYGINWFSRVSGLSNTRETETTFALADIATLLPPLNFAVQLVQQEEPPVLTTVSEQATLQSMINTNPSGDHTLIRVTFDWTHAHHIAHQWANKVQLFFRQNPVRIVRGEIKSVTELPADLVEIRTIGYSSYSSTTIQTFDARVVNGDEARFKGSVFVSDQNQYIVDAVEQSNVAGEGSVFRIKKIVQGSAQDVDNNDGFIVTDDFISPSAGERFFVTENLGEASNWTDGAAGTGQPLTKEISITKFSEHQEQVTEYDGTITTLNIGGIYEPATVTEIEDVDENGNPIPGSHTGIYEIVFNAFVLADHPDVDVDWYRGVARIPLAASTDKKVLTVIDIGVQGGFLKILATDPEGAGAPDAIQTGAGINVNFHPGYRIYLKAQTGVLTKATTVPAAGQRIKQTLMGARSVDTTLGAVSSVSTPSVMLAREIIIPVPPEQPTGAVFATRPDYYGKATYTFDTTVVTTGGRKPLALVFYRANERAVLDALYAPETVRAILSALESLPADDAAFYYDRFRDLVKMTLGGDGKFKQYVPGGYRFPNPDNNKYIVPDPDPTNPPVRPFVAAPNPGTIVNAVKAAIEGVFFPLTEQPVFYSAIRSGRRTVNRKPVIRDSNGEYLLPTDPEYDPAPMAVILPSTNTVRFTDYTLDGSSTNIYFYFVRELNDLYQFSAPSPVLGPVRLINTFPSEAPGIKKVTVQVEDPLQQTTTAVVVEVNAYLAAENIKKFQLYRATNVQDASSVRTMKLVTTASVEDGTTILDEFSDLTVVPYGDPLFYRVIALREIVNESEAMEYVPSQPSKVVMASIIDVVNPAAPSLTAEVGLDVGTSYQEVKLSWNRTAYNGTYYLFRMTANGNWFKIHEISSNDETIAYEIPEDLPKLDDEGRRIYHRFKVDVENSSGLLNLEEAPFVL